MPEITSRDLEGGFGIHEHNVFAYHATNVNPLLCICQVFGTIFFIFFSEG
jgi:hypothetical protein